MSVRMPERLQGQWQHALFTTYTIDLEFFEHQLWWPLPETCRNVVVLADEERFFEACEAEAPRRLVTHLNRRYVVDGLRFPGAAHSKVVLLTDETSGRLMVGSGNLGAKGWVRGGEVFMEYNYADDAADELPAFIAVRDLLAELLEQERIVGLARERVELLLDETPWLYQGVLLDSTPVHHNLSRSLFEQLVETVAGRSVQELRILSPFYDPAAAALEQFLAAFAPERSEVYVEPGCTSVDPQRLAAVRDAQGKSCVVRPFKREGCDYVHAKAYLVKTADAALLLTGSPNLSRSAMLNVAPQSNLEVASLLSGARGDFDYLFDELAAAAPEDDLGKLGLELSETPAGEGSEGIPTLVRAVLRRKVLELQVRGELPALAELALLIGAGPHPLEELGAAAASGGLTVPLSDKLREELAGFQPLRIRWRRPDGSLESNAVFLMDQAALAAEARSPQARAVVSAFTGIPLDDELAGVVMPLEIVFGDFRAAWHPAVKASNPAPSEEDEQLFILYDDVDLKALRQHPKIQQYLHSHGVSTAQDGEHWTVLDSVPLSVAEFFKQFAKREGHAGRWQEEEVVVGEDGVSVTVEEAQTLHAQRLDLQQRRQVAVKRFVGSCLAGVTSEGFRTIAGYVFVSRVYAIFHHTLLRFAEKRWVDLAFLGESVAQLWEFYWGTAEEPGFFFNGTEAERGHAHKLLADCGEPQTLLAMMSALCAAAMPSHVQPLDDDLRRRLRDVLRGLLLCEPLAYGAEGVEAAVSLCSWLSLKGAFSPAQVRDCLLATERSETPSGFVAELAERMGPAAKGAGFVEGVHCHRPAIDRDWSARCLEFIYDSAVDTPDKAAEVLRDWMRWQPELEYYRLCYPPEDAVHLAFYDRVSESGAYLNRRDGGGVVKIGRLAPLEPEWQSGIKRLVALFDSVGPQDPCKSVVP